MKRTGTTDLPLHGGKAPRWLFERMSLLAGEIVSAIALEFGPVEVLRRLSDPAWFQAFGCVLGFDWHSSGVTTTVTGAIKEGLKGREEEVGIFPCGGKGGASRKTPGEILTFSDRVGTDGDSLVYASRISAKVDSAAVQDGYQIYHHAFFFTREGEWAVVQQGMNEERRRARRYHWISESVRDFVEEPHAAVCCDGREKVLNLVAKESSSTRSIIAELSRMDPEKVVKLVARANEGRGRHLEMPVRHPVRGEDIRPENLRRILLDTYEKQPEDFETLLGVKGVGPKTLRALSLVSEVIYGAPPSFRDPARFSFAHGGKDGTPYPVNRAEYDRTIDVMRGAVEKAKIGRKEKMEALKRLSFLFPS
ncbi:MAG: DUF763 domain-containing protein [Deltaproteobacteria bacterium]|nr:MAG: DUF763 domain-containing protein [Deltaproteobacteria bacterium]